MRRLLLLIIFAAGVLAQTQDQKMRDAQKAFGAGDCVKAQAALREVIASDPKNYVAHLLSANCSLKQKDYKTAAVEYRRALDLRPAAPPALLGLIQTYALAGDKAHRDSEIAALHALIETGKVPRSIRFVREPFKAADRTVLASEYPYVTAVRTRYAFDATDAQQKPAERFVLMLRESDQRFSLIELPETVVRLYDRGEPAYEQVVADVKAALAKKTPSSGNYALAKNPAIVDPIPITVEDSSDPRMQLQSGQVAIEYIAHSCFRIHTAKGTRIVIDPYASRLWLGYDFPTKLAADAVLITHPHYDHDADTLIGHAPPPWTSDVSVLRNPGSQKIGDVTVTGIRGRHADPWGKEFGQTNTIWLLECDGLRIVHLGDNGPLTEENAKELGRVDVLMMPIDAQHHILKDAEIDAIRKTLHPRVVIPMHYRIPDLEASPDSPQGLGEITPWLTGQQNVVRLDRSVATFSAAALLPAEIVVVFPHSPKVAAPRR